MGKQEREGASPARVLMVCSGNICRSPAMHYLAQREWGEAAEVRSAGTWAEVGMDATPEMRRAARSHSLTIPRHRPTQLDLAALDWADLVLVATAGHARWIADRADAARADVVGAKVFGIKEAAALSLRAARPEGRTAADRIRALAPVLDAERSREGIGVWALDDPWGRDDETYARVMREIAEAVRMLSRFAAV